MITYETDRLRLRNFLPTDGDAVHAIYSLESVAVHEDFDPYTREQSEAALRDWVGSNAHWAVALRDSGAVIGAFHYSPADFGAYEISYDFHEAHTGRGYATEAGRILLRHLFTALDARRVTAGCNEGNTASWRLLERLGFRREGLFLEDVAFKRDAEGNPLYINSYYYALLKKEWSP